MKTKNYETLRLKKIARIELAFKIEVVYAQASFFQTSLSQEKGNHDPMNKFHAIPRFPKRSFAVYIGDHLRSNLGIISGLGIICCGGSFAAL